MIRQFRDDPFIQNMVLSRIRISIPSIFGFSISEYEINFLQSLAGRPQSNYIMIITGFLLTALAILCILIFKIENKLRVD